MIYFNEYDGYPAQWLRNLYPTAIVDDRSIVDVRAIDTVEYLRCHFFAGIGGWECALQLAGWPKDREVWTGSCPCQPFSQAGKRKGTSDERHLWPEFLRLITERRPATIFGEQVASADGRQWLAGVQVDVEALDYQFAAADLCAAGVTAPHIRQRLYWVANRNGSRARIGTRSPRGGKSRNSSGMGDVYNKGSQGRGEQVVQCSDQLSAWASSVAIYCEDGKYRRIEPSTFPLAHGVPNRVGQIRAYGNAIIPQVAAVFIKAFLETE